MKKPANKLFTVEEANRMLPLIRRIVSDIVKAGQDMKTMSRETMTGDHAAILENRIAQLKSYLAELEELGCFYKDWNFHAGIVEFPAEIDGKSAMLCWRSNEPALTEFYFRDEGDGKRQPLPVEAIT